MTTPTADEIDALAGLTKQLENAAAMQDWDFWTIKVSKKGASLILSALKDAARDARKQAIEECAKIAERSFAQACCGKPVAVCCGNPSRNDECCGEPIPDCCNQPDTTFASPDEIAAAIRAIDAAMKDDK